MATFGATDVIKYVPVLIRDEADCRTFFRALYEPFGLVWHPDTRFEDYVDIATGKKQMFSLGACYWLDKAMAKCFELLDERIYDVALEISEEWRAKQCTGSEGDGSMTPSHTAGR